MRGDDDKREAKLKEYSRPQDNMFSDILSPDDLDRKQVRKKGGSQSELNEPEELMVGGSCKRPKKN